MLNRVLAGAGVAAAVVAIGFTGLASARAGDKTFAQTYPYASALCSRVAAGHTPAKLRGSEAQVKQACATLETAFGPLQSAVLAGQSQFAAGVAAARAATQQACAPGQPRPHCRQVRRADRLTIMSLRRQHRAAVRLYYTSIEVNRRRFWSTIRSLRGGRSLTPDRPVAVQND